MAAYLIPVICHTIAGKETPRNTNELTLRSPHRAFRCHATTLSSSKLQCKCHKSHNGSHSGLRGSRYSMQIFHVISLQQKCKINFQLRTERQRRIAEKIENKMFTTKRLQRIGVTEMQQKNANFRETQHIHTHTRKFCRKKNIAKN